MKVYTVIVTFNGQKWIEKSLSSLRNTDMNVEVIVVDNASTDETKQIIKENFPEVNLIESDKNLGFGAANNIGIKWALSQSAEFIFLLNQDAYILDCPFRSLLDTLILRPEIGILSPIHLAGNEKDLDYLFAKYLLPGTTPFILGDSFKRQTQDIYHTRFVNAAAWLVRAEIFKDFGGFHPVFDHYGEDNEFVLRISKKGLKVSISPHHFIVHDRVQTQKSNTYFKDDQFLLRKFLLEDFTKGDVGSNYRLGTFIRYGLMQILKGNWRNAFQLLKTARIYQKKSLQIKTNQTLNYWK